MSAETMPNAHSEMDFAMGSNKHFVMRSMILMTSAKQTMNANGMMMKCRVMRNTKQGQTTGGTGLFRSASEHWNDVFLHVIPLIYDAFCHGSLKMYSAYVAYYVSCETFY